MKKQLDEAKKRGQNNGSPQHLREAAANALLTPPRCAANAIYSMTKDVSIGESEATGVDFTTLLSNLEAANSAVAGGDLGCVEAMLLGQAHVLQSVFMVYMSKMANADHIEQVNSLSRIALRAQNQSRQTLATLVELKNPKRAMFIKQQNNAVNQQINQGGGESEIQKNSDNPSNELPEVISHEQLDPRTAQASCGANQTMEAVGTLYRAENS